MEINYISDCSEDQVNNVIRVDHVTVAAFRNGKIVFVKRRNSATLELPELKKNNDEKPRDTARRILSDMLGVKTAKIEYITAYSQSDDTDIIYGLLYCAYIDEMGPFPHSELSSVYYLDTPPEDKDKWSFPDIHMALLDKANEFQNR